MASSPLSIKTDELLSVLEAAFAAGIKEIRRIRAGQEEPRRRRPVRKDAPTSKMANAIDILTQSTQPVHVMDLIAALEERGLVANRDAMVSALTKALAPHGPLQRTAPNTFWIAGRKV